jgi:hypothetical protein
VIGFGRFGQIVSQCLLAEAIDVTTIDNDPEMIQDAGGFGFKVYYGDGTRLDVLRAAGAGDARLIAVCIDNREAASRIVDLVHAEFPGRSCTCAPSIGATHCNLSPRVSISNCAKPMNPHSYSAATRSKRWGSIPSMRRRPSNSSAPATSIVSPYNRPKAYPPGQICCGHAWCTNR